MLLGLEVGFGRALEEADAFAMSILSDSSPSRDDMTLASSGSTSWLVVSRLFSCRERSLRMAAASVGGTICSGALSITPNIKSNAASTCASMASLHPSGNGLAV